MKNIKGILSIAIALIVCSLNAGHVLTFEKYGAEEVTYYESGKSATYENGELVNILDLKNGVIIEINHANQAFAKTKLADLGKITSEMMKNQMGAAMNDPMFKKMIEHQKKVAKETKIEIEKLGSKSIAGVKSEGFKVKKNGKLSTEKWISKELTKSIAADFDYVVFQKSMAELDKALAEFMPSDPETDAAQKIEQAGIAVYEAESSEFDFGDGPEVVTRLVAVAKENISADMFVVPEGYEEVDFLTIQSMEEEEDEDEDVW